MTDTNPPAATCSGRKRFFTGPLDDWPNDDLLFEHTQREFVYRHHQRAAPIFDWPALRALFGNYDPPAGRFRTRSRRNGVLAVLLGCLGLILTAIAAGNLVADTAWPRQLLGGTGGALALASALVGMGGVLRGSDKSRWLKNRFWTERMRQLHFQLIINNLPLAVAIVEGRAPIADWEMLRGRILDEFVHRQMEPVESSLERMRRDVADDQPWLDPSWAHWPDLQNLAARQPGDETAALDELFEILKYQRFGIQRRYAGYKLTPGFASPKSRSDALRLAADLMTGFALVIGAVAGVFFVFAPKVPALEWLLVSGAVLAALILGIRVLDEGLQLRSETERYIWYLAAVEALERRYDEATAVQGKVEILRDMERLSYQELRWFTTSFDEARFVM